MTNTASKVNQHEQRENGIVIFSLFVKNVWIFKPHNYIIIIIKYL